MEDTMAVQSTTKPEDLEFMRLLGRIQTLPEAKKEELRQHVIGNQEPIIPATPRPKGNYVIGKPKGLREPGNINLDNRPTIQNEDGSHSSEYSTSFGTDKGEVLVPTIVGGKFLTPNGKKPPEGSEVERNMFNRAREHYQNTGEHMGIFDTPENADAYANTVHNRGPKTLPPVKASQEAVQEANQPTGEEQ
jgi:hypothetical protein